jgi:hypothetical protein
MTRRDYMRLLSEQWSPSYLEEASKRLIKNPNRLSCFGDGWMSWCRGRCVLSNDCRKHPLFDKREVVIVLVESNSIIMSESSKVSS